MDNLPSCAIVASYGFTFRDNDPRRIEKTIALKDCIYRGKGRLQIGFCQSTCSHPEAGNDNNRFLADVCPRRAMFLGK